MKLEFKNSFPKILSNIVSDKTMGFYESLPLEYKRFLDNTNGGFVDEFKYTFKTGVPYKTKKVNNPSRTDCLVEVFRISSTEKQSDKYPRDLIETASEHDSEEFLPSRVIAIASCIQNSLICISLGDKDFGQIYYWDWYWQYPWCQEFFQARINDVTNLYPTANEILDNPQNELYQTVSDAFNYATIVKIANSFDDFLSKLYDARKNK